MSDVRVGVKATFTVRGEAVHHFTSSEQNESPADASAGVGQQGPVEGTDKYDYRYTGTHDHGTLPALKTGGPHGELANALLGAKADSDAFLTGLINQELAKSSGDTDTSRAEAGPPGGQACGEGDKQQRQSTRHQPEAMEVEPPRGAGGGAASAPSGSKSASLPPPPPTTTTPTPTPPATQPAKRPRP